MVRKIKRWKNYVHPMIVTENTPERHIYKWPISSHHIDGSTFHCFMDKISFKILLFPVKDSMSP
jgi:hypothetical protein